MGDIELHRSGPPGLPDGPDRAVRWGLLLSVALHAGIVALLVGGAEPPVHHEPASPFDVTFVDGETPSDPQPAASAAPAPSPAASPATPPATPPTAVPVEEDTAAETKPPPAAEAPAKPSEATPTETPPRPTEEAVEPAAEPAPQPATAPPPVPAHRPPPPKPVAPQPAPPRPAPAQAAPARIPLTGTSVAAEAARSWRPPSGSTSKAPPDRLQSAYAGLVKAQVARNMIHPREDEPPRPSRPVVVRFNILADGSIRNLVLVSSSGDGLLDRAAREAILRAAPFPPIPETVKSRWIDMTVDMYF
ncbi:cell envelope integrity protein TolA [Azospirillum sp. A26]|uniref:cell envelope integrity protein TolA n=1 Tax=Azospirillum sp. A26 TaxID=3160607 RepID=UPI00366BA7B0